MISGWGRAKATDRPGERAPCPIWGGKRRQKGGMWIERINDFQGRRERVGVVKPYKWFKNILGGSGGNT